LTPIPLRLLAGRQKDVGELQGVVLHAGGGLLVYLVIMTFAVYTLGGLTPYGWRKLHE
jgi:hypothetical protein